jgi:hypothetical protein
MEQREKSLPILKPGERATVNFKIETKDARRVQFDVIRPTGFSAFTLMQKV